MIFLRRDFDLVRNQIVGADESGLANDSAIAAGPVSRERCELLGPTALVVQGLMGILVILSLVYKRHREKPRRKWKIWMFDVSKQVLGQMVVHGTNVFIASLVGHVSSANPCAQYFLHVLIDTTIGVGVLWGILKAFTWLFTHKLDMKGFESGQYGDPPSLAFWGRQAAVYVLSLLTMKLLVLLFVAIAPFLSSSAEWLLGWFSDDAQVVLVMGIFPVIMNILQFWIIDSIVKASAHAGISLDSPIRDSEQEPIFNAGDDSDDEDTTPKRPEVVREHSYPPAGSANGHSRPASPVPGAVAPPPIVHDDR